MAAISTGPQRVEWQKRHRLSVRILHWINALALLCLFMSGLQIFNAHPALYWGSVSAFDRPLAALTADTSADGTVVGGRTAIGRHSVQTTGLLGASAGDGGTLTERGFPSWITLPGQQDLATGRRWHFFFAWVFVTTGILYMLIGLINRHIRLDLVPTREQMGHIGQSILDHARLRFPKGEDAKRYNAIQKITYLVMIFVVLPLALLTGLTMSPGMDAALPWLLSVFGGRQSARTIHFILAWSIVLFAFVHVAMVILSGVWNNIRSMITGWYAVEVPETTYDT